MTLREALADYKRHEGHETKFPGERRSTEGLFTGDQGRLVHVSPDGSICDFGYSLSELAGIQRARFGFVDDDEVSWFQGVDQHYEAGGSIVHTTHDAGGLAVEQHDATVDGAHLTAFETPGEDADRTLVVRVSFTPNGRTDRVGHLRHGDAVEVYHTDEHDFLASATGIDSVEGAMVGFADVLAPEPAPDPVATERDRYEEGSLTGDLVLSVPLPGGSGALVTLAVHETTTDRESALARARELAGGIDGPGTLRDLTRSTPFPRPAGSVPQSDVVAADLRVLGLLSAPTGLRVAGPEFDPFYAHSGGYGYTWFRDDAEVARLLLGVDRELDVDLSAWHRRSAEAYCETQLEDGTWPHRVWAFDGSIAPGWANARLEAGSGAHYQADQTASVASFLAAYHDRAPEDLRPAIESALDRALEGLDDSLGPDGRPVVCQNAWENMEGRFTHTAATFLGAYARIAAADLSTSTTELARDRASTVYEAIPDLWVPDRGAFALRETPDGAVDDRLDSATFALVGAHAAYDRIATVEERRIRRIVSHVETTVEGLYRDTPAIAGLIRFEGDTWRRRSQDREKVWTVSTGAGAHACGRLATLLDDAGPDRSDEFERRARDLLDPLLLGGSLCVAGGYLPEQFYDDGRPDSATPLGWSHAIRSATVAELVSRGALRPTARPED